MAGYSRITGENFKRVSKPSYESLEQALSKAKNEFWEYTHFRGKYHHFCDDNSGWSWDKMHELEKACDVAEFELYMARGY